MKALIINRSGRAVPRKFLLSWVRRMDRAAQKWIAPRRYHGRELVIAFVDESEMKRLNREYRGRNYATDVLSFESDDSGSLGELVICPSVISSQAREHGILVREELGYMILHGFLHLLGYDHERVSRREGEKMFAIQDALFEVLRK